MKATESDLQAKYDDLVKERFVDESTIKALTEQVETQSKKLSEVSALSVDPVQSVQPVQSVVPDAAVAVADSHLLQEQLDVLVATLRDSLAAMEDKFDIKSVSEAVSSVAAAAKAEAEEAEKEKERVAVVAEDSKGGSKKNKKN